MSATHEVTGHSEIPAKDVVPLLPPERRLPLVVERVSMEGEMPEATGITKGIEGTLPGLE